MSRSSAPASRPSSTAPRRGPRRDAAMDAIPRQLRKRLELERLTVDVDGRPIEVLCDVGESPLGWLRRRQGPDGRPLIDDAAFAAGERLRVDITCAGLLPRMTLDWSRPPGGAGKGPVGVADVALDARARVAAAARAVGPDLAGVLIDVCGFLKGLEVVERERGWPARSAKVVLGIALARLADHYGIAAVARGPAAARTRHWRAPDARPVM